MKPALNALPDAFNSQYFDLDDAGDAQEFYHSRELSHCFVRSVEKKWCCGTISS